MLPHTRKYSWSLPSKLGSTPEPLEMHPHTYLLHYRVLQQNQGKPFFPSKLSRKTELDLNNSLKKYMKTHCKGVRLRMHSGGFFLLKAYISFNIPQQSHSNSGRGSTDCTRTLIFLPSHWVCRCFSGRRGLQTVHRCYNQSTGLEDDWKKFQSSYWDPNRNDITGNLSIGLEILFWSTSHQYEEK